MNIRFEASLNLQEAQNALAWNDPQKAIAKAEAAITFLRKLAEKKTA